MLQFALSQQTVDRERAKQRESRLQRLHPIFRFFRDQPLTPAEMDEVASTPQPPREAPRTFCAQPLTAISPRVELQLGAIEAGEAGAAVVSSMRVPDPETLSSLRANWWWHAVTRRGLPMLGGVMLLGLAFL